LVVWTANLGTPKKTVEVFVTINVITNRNVTYARKPIQYLPSIEK
jgi:hypothetical protein